MIGTYRPVEAIVHHHPLRTVVQDLQRHGHATELALALLNAEAVAAYLAALSSAGVPGHAGAVATPADGRPSIVSGDSGAGVRGAGRAARAGRVLDRAGGHRALALEVPESLRQLLEQQIARLPPEVQRVLEVASVAGVEFVAAAVAAGLVEADPVEEHCEALVEQQLLHLVGVTTWPNGTVTARYSLCACPVSTGSVRAAGGRAARAAAPAPGGVWKRPAGRRDRCRAGRALARGQDIQRAVRYRHRRRRMQHTGLPCGSHQAPTPGLEMLTCAGDPGAPPARTRPAGAPRRRVGANEGGLPPKWDKHMHAPTRYVSASESLRSCRRCCGAVPVVWHTGRVADSTQVRRHLLTLAQRQADPVLLLLAHATLGGAVLSWGGGRGTRTFRAGERAVCPGLPPRPGGTPQLDLGVYVRCFAALSLWLLGAPSRAWHRCTKHEPWPRSYRTPIVWLCLWDASASVAAGRAGHPDMGRPSWPSALSTGLGSMYPKEAAARLGPDGTGAGGHGPGPDAPESDTYRPRSSHHGSLSFCHAGRGVWAGGSD